MAAKKDDSHIVRKTIRRINGHLKEFTEVLDSSGTVLSHFVSPLMIELKARDVIQILVGSSLLAVPISFTEEAWTLGAELPLQNVWYLWSLGIIFLSSFVYFNFYRGHLTGNLMEFFKRVFAIHLLSLVVVGIILTIIQKCPWGVDNLVAIKRILVIGFPCSMSAAVADNLK